jgi:phosphoglycerate dehydrogenase-like enzyme
MKAVLYPFRATDPIVGLVRRLPDLAADQRGRRWRHDDATAKVGTLAGAVVCIVGLSAIGRAVARKAKAFDAHVIAVSRAGTAGDAVDEVYPRPRMAQALARADAVVICTSSDAESFHLIDAAALAALGPKAVLVNVARGDLLDGAALIDALQAGRLGGAALDVTEVEPLAPESPLWDLPNVVVSPHVAGGGSNGYQQQKDLFGRNLLRFFAGEPLLNVCRRAGSPDT